MNIDHELSKKELAVRILGLIHIVNLYGELGEYSFEYSDELSHAAFVLAEMIVLDDDV